MRKRFYALLEPHETYLICNVKGQGKYINLWAPQRKEKLIFWHSEKLNEALVFPCKFDSTSVLLGNFSLSLEKQQ